MTDNAPPVGKLARATVVGVMAAKIGAKKVGLLSKRPFLSREAMEVQRQESDDEVAAALFQGLSRLRGTALKLSQFLSLELGVLPERYCEELSKSHYRVPPLNRAVVRSLLIREFGRPPEEIFAKFEATAFAAASLGQVHRATLPTGDRVAVKVQYPGIDRALENDLGLAKRVGWSLLRTDYSAAVLREIERRLSDEVDYEVERDQTQWFHDHARTPGIVIPRTFAAYSSRRVLTTELLHGAHLDQWLATGPSQEQRDCAAQRMYDFFMHTAFELRRIHADPNPGNYLFRDDGTIAVIDFGSVKAFDPGFCDKLAELCRAYLRNDFDTAVSMYCAMGMAGGERGAVGEFFRTKLLPFGTWLMRPYRDEVFDFGAHPEHCGEGARFFRELFPAQSMNGFTPETVMFDRNMHGLFRVFTRLGARVRLKNRWLY